MSQNISKATQMPGASAGTLRQPKGLALVVVLSTLQGFISLGMFARIFLWGTNGAANVFPDASLSSIFANTAFFRISLGQMTVGDVSLWVERAVLLGLGLSLTLLAWRMRSRKLNSRQ